MECCSNACVVLEDGKRFVCRAGSSQNKIIFSGPCKKSGQGFQIALTTSS